ncbi:hypothetical protein [Vibrio sp. S11_S32]|uniref:hypothetical protein n=1 Tax=Vibrio sp. S11_S32 TaxID=2720225 RepID=UPI00406CE9D3
MWCSGFKIFNALGRWKQQCKTYLARYDAWCEELGLTPEHKRSCCAYKADPIHQKTPADKTYQAPAQHHPVTPNFKA